MTRSRGRAELGVGGERGVKMKAVAIETKMLTESYQAIKLSNSKFRTKTTCDTIVDNTNYVESLSYKI